MKELLQVAEIIKAPSRPTYEAIVKPSIFLGGSIEMGLAEDWQTLLEQKLKAYDVVIYNPRRDDWDSSWEQKIDNPQFNEQVNWELDMQMEADLRVYYFSPETKAPITLLELGLFASYHTIVCCPEGFWRKGNVDIVCDGYSIPLYNNFDEFAHQIEMWCIDRI